MKRIKLLSVVTAFALSASAQTSPQESQAVNEQHSEYIPVSQYWREHNILQHLDLSVTAGSTGIGLELSSPITDLFQVRVGYEFTPRITKKVKFNVTMGGESAIGSEKFARMSNFMKEFSGYEVEDHVDMLAKPTMNNFKLLFDVFPFKHNKHWHFTAGVYWGSSQIAEAQNTTESMTSLLSVGMYNRIYDKALNQDPLMDFTILGIDEEIIAKYHLGVVPIDLYERIVKAGRLGFTLGYFNYDMVDDNGNVHLSGEKYNMEPGSDSMVRVKAKANSLKPYVGFGYGGRLVKGRDDWQISFDAGALFWGGSPDLYTHDGVNLVKDVRGITGQPGNYVDICKSLKLYPVLSLKITKRLF